jgi:deazaflavin-dependent oxidoreductase (nitroreductase family)
MLILTRSGDDLVVCASNGGSPKPPSWFLNLRDAGRARVEVDSEVWDVTAREVGGSERDECWRNLCDVYPDFATYQARTRRRLPVMLLKRS